jgi:hypothetical protein
MKEHKKIINLKLLQLYQILIRIGKSTTGKYLFQNKTELGAVLICDTYYV